MGRLTTLASTLLLAAVAAPAATLQQMSLEDLAQQSTAIVWGRAGSQRVVRDGPLIYTLTRLEILEQWKGEPASEFEIALPGGRLGDLSQRFGGVPQLESGSEFLVFLWTGPSGRTQITGLSQGLFELLRQEGTPLRVVRKPSAELMLAPGSATPVENPAIDMPLADFIARIQSALAGRRNVRP